MNPVVAFLANAWSRLRPAVGAPRRFLGGLLFAATAFACNLYFTFPADALGERLAYELQQRSSGAWRLTFSQAATWRLSGLTLTNVDLHRQAAGEVAPAPIHLDVLQARLQVVPLLLRRPRLVARATQGSGTLSAWLAPGAQTLDVEASVADLSFNQPALQEATGLAFAGNLAGQLDGHWESDPGKWSGDLKLEARALNVGPGAVSGMSLPQVDFGDLDMHLKVNEAVARLHAFRQHGGVVSLGGRGSASLKAPLALSTVDLCTTLRVAPEFLAKQPKLSTALQIAAAQLKRDADGTLHLPLQGSLMAPRLGNAPCH